RKFILFVASVYDRCGTAERCTGVWTFPHRGAVLRTLLHGVIINDITGRGRIFLEAFGSFLPSFAMAVARHSQQEVLEAAFAAAIAAVAAVVACGGAVPVSVVSLGALGPAWPGSQTVRPPALRLPARRLWASFAGVDDAEASA